MTMAHIGAWKLATLVFGALAAVLFAMDPSVKVMVWAILIAGLPATITGVFNVTLQFMARGERRSLHATMNEVKVQTDGMLAQLRSENKTQGAELKDANQKVDIAQGRQDERDSTGA
jgi:hypothetical protein